MKPTYPRCALIGRQAVQKFAKSETTDPDAVMDLVDIYLVALRLPVVQTDILITLNAPHGKVWADSVQIINGYMILVIGVYFCRY